MTGRRSSSTPDAPATPRLTWRWPELLVGALSLAVVAGLGGLLLSERLGSRQTAETQPQVTTSAIPSSPGTVTEAAAPAASTPAGSTTSGGQSAQAGSIPPAPASPPVAKIPPPVLPEPEPIATPAPATSAPTTTAPTQTPAQGQTAPQNQTSVNAAAPAQSPAQTPPQTQATPTPANEPATPTAVPRAGGAVAPSEQRTPLRSDYRVMLGTFGSRASLQAATAQVSALGYTVYAIDLGNQFVAQVGPYANEATGREAVADIRRVYGRAELYLPRGQTPSATAAASQTSQAQAPAAEAAESVSSAPAQETATTPAPPQAAEAPATPAPAPSGPTYLQVGAFNNPEGAQRFVEQLRAQGFVPSVNAPAGGKVTVLVGPFTGDALLQAEGQLDRAGLEHFRLR